MPLAAVNLPRAPRLALALWALAALACQTLAPAPPTPTTAPPPTPAPHSGAGEMFYAEQTYTGQLTLQSATLPLGECEQTSPFERPSAGLIQVAFVPTEVCFNGEIGLIELGERLLVAQSGGYLAAFSLTDVTDPARPEFLGAWEWLENTYTGDVKPFRQGERWFLALSMEGFAVSAPGAPCGIAIVEVSDPALPRLVGNYHGRAVHSAAPWCHVHTTEIVTDENGDGTHLLASSDDTADLRVLDLRDLPQVRESGRYRLPDIQLNADGSPAEFVHDSTIVGDRVYVSYWGGGLVILDTNVLIAGGEPAPLNAPHSIDPEAFEIHHAYPTTDGGFVFLEDEVNFEPEFSQLRLWDIRDLGAPREALALTLDDPLSPPHNLLVHADLLFVGWYNDGVQVFRYDVGDPAAPQVEPAYSQPVRPPPGPGEYGYDIFNGVYGVRLHDCPLDGRAATCIYASDMTLGLLILALPPEAR
jgi:hypothetical protein